MFTAFWICNVLVYWTEPLLVGDAGNNYYGIRRDILEQTPKIDEIVSVLRNDDVARFKALFPNEVEMYKWRSAVFQRSLLSLAVQCEALHCIRELIRISGTVPMNNWNYWYVEKPTALHTSMAATNDVAAWLLLKYGWPTEVRDEDGRTAIFWSLHSWSKFRMMVAFKAELTVKDAYGESLLHALVRIAKHNQVKPEDASKIASELLKAGVSYRDKSREGLNVLERIDTLIGLPHGSTESLIAIRKAICYHCRPVGSTCVRKQRG